MNLTRIFTTIQNNKPAKKPKDCRDYLYHFTSQKVSIFTYRKKSASKRLLPATFKNSIFLNPYILILFLRVNIMVNGYEACLAGSQCIYVDPL